MVNLVYHLKKKECSDLIIGISMTPITYSNGQPPLFNSPPVLRCYHMAIKVSKDKTHLNESLSFDGYACFL